MNIHRISALILRQLYLMKGSPVRILPLFIWVAVDIILWGFITKYLDTVTSPGLNLTLSLLGAVLLWDFFVRIMHGLTTAMLEDVWARNFLNVFTTPLTVSEYIIALASISILTSIVGLVIMLGLALPFGFSFFAYGLMIVPFLGVLLLFGIALGIMACAMILRLGPASEWLMWPIPALLSPFAGVFYPIATLPVWMQTISYALPPSYIFQGLRDIVQGNEVTWEPLAWAYGLVILYIGLACWYFAQTFKRAVRTGLIARYSAESIN